MSKEVKIKQETELIIPVTEGIWLYEKGRKMFVKSKAGLFSLIAIVLLLSVGVVGAQDTVTVSVWINAGSEPSCTAPLIMEGFNSMTQSRSKSLNNPNSGT